MLFRKTRVYADAAAATPLSLRAKAKLAELLELFGNPSALHKEAVAADKELQKARTTAAAVIGAHSDEIVFTGSGTEANNLALQGVLRPLLRERGEVHVITTAIEHPSILEVLRALEHEGLYVTELPVDSEGSVEPKAIAEAVNEQTALVSVQMVNSEVGTIQNIRDIARLLRRKANLQKRGNFSAEKFPTFGAVAPADISSGFFPTPLLHADASQAPLWLDIKVEKLGVDLLTLDGQKIMGPKGVGALYIKRGTAIEPLLWGGGQEGGVRSSTENVASIGSFAVALEDAQSGVEERAAKGGVVRDYLWSEIQKVLPDASLHGPLCQGPCLRVANNLNFSIPGLDGQMAVIALDALGVAASTRSACDTEEEEPSHVLTALGVNRELARCAIRLTLLPNVTKRQSDAIVRALVEVAGRYINK